MIKSISNEDGDSIARTDVNHGKVNLSVGVGAYQVTEFTPEQAKALALDLMMWADYLTGEDRS